MATAVFWQILQAVQSGIQDDLDLIAQGSDSTSTIASEAIVIRKLIKQIGNELYESDELRPGILITPANKVIRDPNEGTNQSDDARYYVLCQIIDGDDMRDEDNLQSYLKWQEQIAKYFNAQPLLDVQGEEGCVGIGHATEVDVVDPTLFVRHRDFVGGVLIEFISREDRGITT
jgi:hypothetical protein